MDDKQRIALVETRTLDTAGNDPAPQQLILYQFGNHLGSAGLELDHQAQIVSYEEYTPYGSTSYQAARSQTETPRRYRYSGKERDEESGLYYHGVRYYAPWLGRWTAADPWQLIDGANLYYYVTGNPIRLNDPNGTEPNDTVRYKYLILYDKGNTEFKRQAIQAAKDHSTQAYSVESKKLDSLIKKTKPDVIMNIGHGSPGEMSTGDSEWIDATTLKRELKEAKQEKEIRFVGQVCYSGVEGGLMDTSQKEEDLKNYTFVSHTDRGHPTRNSDIRFAGGTDLPAFIAGRVESDLVFDKESAETITSDLLRTDMKKIKDKEGKSTDAPEEYETGKKGEINIVIREISVLGFEDFWRLVTSSTDVKADSAVLSLNLTPEALNRFEAGMTALRSRLDVSVVKGRQKDTAPVKHP